MIEDAAPGAGAVSAAVLLSALPGRSSPASASPPATSGRSKNASNGWKPKVFFRVAAAFCFSLNARLMVASKSIRSSPLGCGAAPNGLALSDHLMM